MKQAAARAALAIAAAALSALAVSGCGSSGEEAPPPVVKTAQYNAYLEENVANLVRAIQSMQPELEHGEAARAGSRYLRSRVRYSQIEPAAEAFPRLDSRINASAGEVPASAVGGFQRILKALVIDESTAGMTPVGKQLIADAKALQRRLESTDFSAAQVAAGASRVLAEISGPKLDFDWQGYAEPNLAEVSANLEAVGAAFEALKPALTEDERTEIGAALKRAYVAIGEYGTPARDPDQPRARSPGTQFIVFSELSEAEVNALKHRIDALAEPFGEVEDRLK